MSRPFSEIHCVVCRRPVDLNTDLCADENGKAVHEECFWPAHGLKATFCFQGTQRTNNYSRQRSRGDNEQERHRSSWNGRKNS
jgi:hypothetical protein